MGNVLFCCDRTLDKLKLEELLAELYPPLAPDAAELIDGLDEADDLEPFDEPYEHERERKSR